MDTTDAIQPTTESKIDSLLIDLQVDNAQMITLGMTDSVATLFIIANIIKALIPLLKQSSHSLWNSNKDFAILLILLYNWTDVDSTQFDIMYI